MLGMWFTASFKRLFFLKTMHSVAENNTTGAMRLNQNSKGAAGSETKIKLLIAED